MSLTGAQIRSVAEGLESFGLDLPQEVTEAYDTYKLLHDHGNEPEPFGDYKSAAVDAYVDALTRGVDPLTDKKVHSAWIASRLADRSLLRDATTTAEHRAYTAVRHHADTIVDTLRGVFDTAVDKLTKAHTTLTVNSLDDATAILNLGGDAAATWAKARTAQKDIHRIVTIWRTLFMLVNGGAMSKWSTFAIVADVDPLEYVKGEYYTNEVGADPWRALVDGHPLRLATLAQIQAHRPRCDEAVRADRLAHTARDPLRIN